MVEAFEILINVGLSGFLGFCIGYFFGYLLANIIVSFPQFFREIDNNNENQ